MWLSVAFWASILLFAVIMPFAAISVGEWLTGLQQRARLIHDCHAQDAALIYGDEGLGRFGRFPPTALPRSTIESAIIRPSNRIVQLPLVP